MTSSLYIDRPSPIHALHPITKMIGVAAFFAAVFSLEQPLAILDREILERGIERCALDLLYREQAGHGLLDALLHGGLELGRSGRRAVWLGGCGRGGHPVAADQAA